MNSYAQRWEAIGQCSRYQNRWQQCYEDVYNERNPVDNTVLDELPSNNEHEHMWRHRPKPVLSRFFDILSVIYP